MNKPKAPKLVTVAIFTTITVVFWVFMGLYNIITSEPPANVDPELLSPINPVLDRNSLDRVEGRIFFEQGETTSPVIINQEQEAIPESEEESVEIEAENESEIPSENFPVISPTLE